jgi:hypothetical protein
MGKNIFNCGRVSGGQVSKISNNSALAIQLISICEANILGERLGMDLFVLNDIFKVIFSEFKIMISRFQVPDHSLLKSSTRYQDIYQMSQLLITMKEDFLLTCLSKT